LIVKSPLPTICPTQMSLLLVDSLPSIALSL
jgi:hypothetical protein